MGVIDLRHGLGDGLAVRDLRLADVRLHLELTTHPVYEHLKVKLTHSTDDGLAGFLVSAHVECRVLLS